LEIYTTVSRHSSSCLNGVALSCQLSIETPLPEWKVLYALVRLPHGAFHDLNLIEPSFMNDFCPYNASIGPDVRSCGDIFFTRAEGTRYAHYFLYPLALLFAWCLLLSKCYYSPVHLNESVSPQALPSIYRPLGGKGPERSLVTKHDILIYTVPHLLPLLENDPLGTLYEYKYSINCDTLSSTQSTRLSSSSLIEANISLPLLLPLLKLHDLRNLWRICCPTEACPAVVVLRKSLISRQYTLNLRHFFSSSSTLTTQRASNRPIPSPSTSLNRRNLAADQGHPSFPPKPLTPDEKGDIIRRFVRSISYEELEESICGCCGRLSPVKTMTSYSLSDPVTKILSRDGSRITRIERFSSSEPIREIVGPILHPIVNELGFIPCCTECHHALKVLRLPKASLANGNWVGETPKCLLELNFVEKLLVSKHHHNVCVVKVSQGHSRLRCNAVVHARPIQKVISFLPPTPKELSEVLAIVFTGAKRPDPSTFERTPLLVRRSVVRQALQWLILNHDDYSDISLSDENLHMYRENEPPVCIISRINDKLEPVPPEAQGFEYNPNSFDLGWKGNESCEFAVSGLSEAEYQSLSSDLLKMKAMEHLHNGGRLLAIGHDESAQSLFHNPSLFPSMFPWLYPYGKGGFQSLTQQTKISPQVQCAYRLMYGDRRFQTDEYFMYIAFNHEQIKAACVQNSLSVKRSSWQKIESMLHSADPNALSGLIKKTQGGLHNVSLSEREKQWLTILQHVELVSSAVHGSRASKRLRRNEIRSMLMHSGLALWFITISPCDWKSPISLYFAGEKLDVLSEGTGHLAYPYLQRRVASNPVACARFFNFMVSNFINKVLGFDNKSPGLFGPVDSYYGTVEEQGRLSLHLHLLVWIKDTPSPQEIKERLADRIQPFTDELLAYLSHSHTGDYLYADENRVGALVSDAQLRTDYRDPTTTLPSNVSDSQDFCESSPFSSEVNSLIYQSNRHITHNARCGGKTGSCKARYPRDIVPHTTVDETGYVTLQKNEPNINTYSPILTYLVRCNTDVSCLLTGTAVKAAHMYISDYITKPGLKTYTAFECILAVYLAYQSLLHEDRAEAARTVILKMVNALTSRSQLGGPLIAAFMLEHGDHYKNRKFQSFFWKSFVDYVAKTFDTVYTRNEWDQGMDHEQEGSALLTEVSGSIRTVRSLDDWIHRPTSLEHMSLYEYTRIIRKRALQDFNGDGDEFLNDPSRSIQSFSSNNSKRFMPDHPQYHTHTTSSVRDPDSWVVNWVGNTLPRLGSGDDEYYYMTMIVLFCPWRDPLLLKTNGESWHDRFQRENFSDRAIQLMKNFRLFHECVEARDDYSSQRRSRTSQNADSTFTLFSDSVQEILDNARYEDGKLSLDFLENEDLEQIASLCIDGNHYRRQCAEADHTANILLSHGWTEAVSSADFRDTSNELIEGNEHTANEWGRKLQMAKLLKLSSQNSSIIPIALTDTNASMNSFKVFQGVKIVDTDSMPDSARLSASIPLQTITSQVSPDKIVVSKYSLNLDQCRAFNLIVSSSTTRSSPLRLYLGGMGGTGKSQVIRALSEYYSLIGQKNCFYVVAPTGSAACLVDGSTYHSFLGLRNGTDRKPDLALFNKFKLIHTIFLDEISMVSCVDLYRISDRLSQLKGLSDVPFGGINMVFAGDFAQLPPAGRGYALYDRIPVRMDQSVNGETKAVDSRTEKAVLGKGLWHQLTHVIILRQNMRLKATSEEDKQFRFALERMRYKKCTTEDIKLLQSRTRSFKGLQGSYAGNISLIVGRNLVRDVCNELGTIAFARKYDLEVFSFQAKDHLPKGAHITNALQDMMLDLRPCRTEHLAGKLVICRGLPVLIKDNQATELCVTNGAEGIVRGWKAYENEGRLHLSVVFVELLKPVRDVQLDGLPLNVVPILPVKERITVKLQTDMKQSIYRTQVPLLPNFAMTDYASQGRTRPVNPVDLKYCRDHRSYYTALSRSTSLAGTYILDSIDTGKVQGGLSGYIRQEFRELEILAHITEMQHEGILPNSINGPTRRSFINSYKAHFGSRFIPPKMPLELKEDEVGASSVGSNSHLFQINTFNTSVSSHLKRDISQVDMINDGYGRQKRRKLAHENVAQTPLPIGCSWNSVNYSCSYDSLYTVLFHIYQQYIDFRTQEGSALLNDLRSSFALLLDNPSSEYLEYIRDDQRQKLHSRYPQNFPFGHSLASVYDVCEQYLPILQISSFRNGRLPISNANCILVIVFGPSRYNVPKQFLATLPCMTEINYEVIGGIYSGSGHFTARIIIEEQVYCYDGMQSNTLIPELTSVNDTDWSMLANRTLHLGLFKKV
jgi:hypothetical protein